MRDRVPPLRRGRTIGAILLVAGVLAMSLTVPARSVPGPAPTPSASGTAAASTSPANSWNNGLISLTFSGQNPSFSVASVANPSVIVRQALTGIAEVNGTDRILSFAPFTSENVSWALTAQTRPTVTQVVLTATVPVVPYGGEWESGDDSGNGNGTIGTANVTITFGLNASSGPDPWTVSYSMNVSGWPWLGLADSLGVEVRSNLTSTLGYWNAGSANAITGLDRGSHAPLAAFRWGATAQARYPSGGYEDSSVGAYHNLSADGSGSLVRLEFGTVTGGYTSLSYDPWLGIVPSSTGLGKLAAWVLTPTTLTIIAGGVLGSLVLAVLARARRSPPETGL